MEYNTAGITEDLFFKVRDYINSLNDQDYFSRSELFKTVYGEEQWVKEACKLGRPLDTLIRMLVVATSFVRATIWSGFWIKSAEITPELTVQKLIEEFEDLQEEE